MAVYLGIDAGTTKIKAALLEGDRIVALSERNAQVFSPFPCACEMDMEALWRLLCDVTYELREKAYDHWRRLSGVAICAQGDGMWPIDANGKSIGNAILWNDTRARKAGVENDREMSEFLVSHCSTALFAGAYPVILQWLKQERPSDYERIAHVFHCKDWLNFRLTGVIASDYSDQSTASINIFTKDYLEELFDRLGIPEMKAALPPLYPSTHVLGCVTEQAHKETGLPVGLPVVTGCIDVAAVALGVGMRNAGDGCCILGTTLCCEMLLDAAQVDVSDTNGSALCSVLSGKYNRVMAANSGTASIDWVRQLLCPELSYAEIGEMVSKVPAGSNGVLFHPYLYGERAPFRDPSACGGFYGLRADHTRMDLMRAAHEGMALSLRDCFEHLPKSEGLLYLSGGGAQSDFTCQLIADTLNKTVLRPVSRELGIQGIMKTARMALENGSPEDACGDCTSFYPDAGVHQTMNKLYEDFTKLRKQAPHWNAR